MTNEKLNIVIIVAVIASGLIMGYYGTSQIFEDQETISILNTKYSDLSQWENSGYGRVTWLQDTPVSNANELVEKMIMENTVSVSQGSTYFVCDSNLKEPGTVGICYHDPKAHYVDP